MKMLFKNATYYRLTGPVDLTKLYELKPADANPPIAACEMQKIGFDVPCPGTSSLVRGSGHGLGVVFSFCMVKTTRILPGAVIKQEVNCRGADIEAKESRKLNRKEWREIREQVEQDLIPKAFTKTTRTHAFFIPEAKALVINTASASVAEELVSHLRKVVGSVPTRLVKTKHDACDVMFRWVRDPFVARPGSILLGHQCDLVARGSDDNSAIKCRKYNLESSEITELMESAFYAAQALELVFDERMTLTVTDTLTLKRLTWHGLVMEPHMERVGEMETKADRYDADMVLNADSIQFVMARLIHEFGGEVV